MKIKIIELEKLIKKLLLIKFSKEEVDLMLPVILFGELSNTQSHGIIRIPSIVNKELKGKLQVQKKTKVSKVIDGKGNPGMLVGATACSEVINIAREFGIGIVGTHGSVSSSGCLSFYAEKIARKELIGIIMARAPGDVAPYGGLERLFGTNPIAFGIPANDKPFIFDMATSAISWGAVDMAQKLGQKLPDNVAIDKSGEYTNDPTKALEGAFLTFDNSYKGYGLAMIVEMLAGVLPGADFLDMGFGDEWGNTFIAISPNTLSNTKDFKKKTRLLIERVRKSKSISGEQIRIPGEGRIASRNEALKKGWVEVDEEILNKLKQET